MRVVSSELWPNCLTRPTRSLGWVSSQWAAKVCQSGHRLPPPPSCARRLRRAGTEGRIQRARPLQVGGRRLSAPEDGEIRPARQVERQGVVVVARLPGIGQRQEVRFDQPQHGLVARLHERGHQRAECLDDGDLKPLLGVAGGEEGAALRGEQRRDGRRRRDPAEPEQRGEGGWAFGHGVGC